MSRYLVFQYQRAQRLVSLSGGWSGVLGRGKFRACLKMAVHVGEGLLFMNHTGTNLQRRTNFDTISNSIKDLEEGGGGKEIYRKFKRPNIIILFHKYQSLNADLKMNESF